MPHATLTRQLPRIAAVARMKPALSFSAPTCLKSASGLNRYGAAAAHSKSFNLLGAHRQAFRKIRASRLGCLPPLRKQRYRIQDTEQDETKHSNHYQPPY